jgi:hypothetical protein
MRIERSVETEGLTGIDHRFCDTHQRTEIAISDGGAHYERVFDCREAYDEFMVAMDCARDATGKASVICTTLHQPYRLFCYG